MDLGRIRRGKKTEKFGELPWICGEERVGAGLEKRKEGGGSDSCRGLVDHPSKPRPRRRHAEWIGNGPHRQGLTRRCEMGYLRLLQQRRVQRHLPRHARVKVFLVLPRLAIALLAVAEQCLVLVIAPTWRPLHMAWNAIAARCLHLHVEAFPHQRMVLPHVEQESRESVSHSWLLVYHHLAQIQDFLCHRRACCSSLVISGQLGEHVANHVPALPHD
mmetsp:Transcript_45603/g.119780  ORF Transcript_45603/g.119780 Transcript_45603/m.119780 type:complete len:217 (+) Transcript_45603:462-1112(+)